MTLEDIIQKNQKETNPKKRFSEQEKDLLRKFFSRSDRIDLVLYTEEDSLLNMLIEDNKSQCYILHSAGCTNKLPPLANEAWFAIYIKGETYTLIKKI